MWCHQLRKPDKEVQEVISVLKIQIDSRTVFLYEAQEQAVVEVVNLLVLQELRVDVGVRAKYVPTKLRHRKTLS